MDLSPEFLRDALHRVDLDGWDGIAGRQLLDHVRRAVVVPVVRRSGLRGPAADQAEASCWAAAWDALRRPTARTAQNPGGMVWVAVRRAVAAEVEFSRMSEGGPVGARTRGAAAAVPGEWGVPGESGGGRQGIGRGLRPAPVTAPHWPSWQRRITEPGACPSTTSWTAGGSPSTPGWGFPRTSSRWWERCSTAWWPLAGIGRSPRTRSQSWPTTLRATLPVHRPPGGVGCLFGSGFRSGRPGASRGCSWEVVAGRESSSSSSGMARRSSGIPPCRALCDRPPRAGRLAQARGWLRGTRNSRGSHDWRCGPWPAPDRPCRRDSIRSSARGAHIMRETILPDMHQVRRVGRYVGCRACREGEAPWVRSR